MATYLMILTILAALMLFSSTTTSFDLNSFNCSSPYTQSLDSQIQVRSCTFLPSTTFTDWFNAPFATLPSEKVELNHEGTRRQ